MDYERIKIEHADTEPRRGLDDARRSEADIQLPHRRKPTGIKHA